MIDKEAIAKKYADERAKRIRDEGTGQYVAMEIGSQMEADPFVDGVAERDPITKDTDVAIVGAGWSGMLAAVRLRKEGVDDFTVIDKAADFGGTWYWNRYPGIACDCEAYVYLPLLEEMGYMPSMRYTPGDEILDYAREVGRRFDLYSNAVFQTVVKTITWNEDALRWIVTTDRGDEIRSRYLILGTGGVLHRPKLPGIPGLESFEGHWFHSSRWDFDYTGGNSRGNLDKLHDKRVALLGTGPTGLQCFPHIANSAAETFLFQRTPMIVGPRDNGETDPQWFEGQEPGWHKRRSDNFEAQMIGVPVEEKIVTDEWTRVWGIPPLEMPADGSAPDMAAYMAEIEDYDLAQMERIRARVDELVDDPEVAESLKPWYATHCKRPSFHDEYLQSFNKPSVHLIDTKGRGPDQITSKGVVFDGKEYEVDLIVYATGFEAAVSPGRSGGFDVTGCGGRTLADAWARRVRTVHGIQTSGFPNMFVIGGLRQAAVSVNLLYVYDEQAKHVANNIKQLMDDGITKLDVTEAAVQEWCDIMDANMDLVFNAEQVRLCTPSYFNNEGNFDTHGEFKNGRPIWADAYGLGPFQYSEVLAKWRDDKEYETKAEIVRDSESVSS
ncbi:flavin-containing monooxygenase [Mycolicibacterium hodleri]|uniref:NAD(P)/FAD-dependent oxidoreductase n=1 Tax=Mycolicibacterium hodleri TaxID=49897 RepID=A0A502E4N5_9MYCO|nr:NAD(P)/FAD-dependent oxidoreductase [Mycolicibacterium hodleri]TPG32467.1 NAD(P)/FAD-dependent oxidoreductase [Mycolicibacterium hodleri]